MSSHHIQSLSDPNYLLRLQNMRISADADAMNSATVLQNRRTNSLNGGNTAESDEFGNALAHGMNAGGNRKPYIDRNAIISASKLSNSYLNNSSPTHSLSGSSQHSGSPRTSLITNAPMHIHSVSHDGQRIVSAAGPVYENLDSYYGANIKSTQPFGYNNHYVPVGVGNTLSSSSIGGGTYEVIGKKMDANGSRFAHTPQPPDIIESTPIYENLSNVSGETTIFLFWQRTYFRNQNDFSLCSTCVGQRANSSVPPPPPPPLLPKKSAQLQNQNDTSGTYVQPQLILSQKYRHESPNHSISAAENASAHVAHNVQYQNSRNNLIAASEKNPTIATYTAQLVRSIDFHNFSIFQTVQQSFQANQIPNFPHTMNISMNPNYIEDFNGSDYVCMTRSIPQSASKLAAMITVPSVGVSQHYLPKMTIATSSTAATASPKHMLSNSVSSIDNQNVGTASAAMQLTSKNLQTLQQQEQLASNAAAQLQISGSSASEKATSVSPTPSQLSSGSSKWNANVLFCML